MTWALDYRLSQVKRPLQGHLGQGPPLPARKTQQGPGRAGAVHDRICGLKSSLGLLGGKGWWGANAGGGAVAQAKRDGGLGQVGGSGQERS